MTQDKYVVYIPSVARLGVGALGNSFDYRATETDTRLWCLSMRRGRFLIDFLPTLVRHRLVSK